MRVLGGGPLEVAGFNEIMNAGSRDTLSVLIGRGTHTRASSLCHERTLSQEGALTRTRPCQHLDLGISILQKSEKSMCVR